VTGPPDFQTSRSSRFSGYQIQVHGHSSLPLSPGLEGFRSKPRAMKLRALVLLGLRSDSRRSSGVSSGGIRELCTRCTAKPGGPFRTNPDQPNQPNQPNYRTERLVRLDSGARLREGNPSARASTSLDSGGLATASAAARTWWSDLPSPCVSLRSAIQDTGPLVAAHPTDAGCLVLGDFRPLGGSGDASLGRPVGAPGTAWRGVRPAWGKADFGPARVGRTAIGRGIDRYRSGNTRGGKRASPELPWIPPRRPASQFLAQSGGGSRPRGGRGALTPFEG